MRVSQFRFLMKVICTWLILGQCCLLAQSDSASGNVGSGALSGGSDIPGATGGGAAMADFQTLMNLIQQTIDPDSWLAAGGTSSILEYPSGVYVDPKGHMQRVRETEALSADLLVKSDSPQHPWRSESQMRTISLKSLDQALVHSALHGLRPSAELLKLAGLSRISHVKIDAANEDILLAGPAGELSYGFELQDLAVVSALIRRDTAPLGCSIDPSNEGLLAAQAFIQEPSTVKKLARNPRLVVEQLQAEIGPHHVSVFGMSPKTGTAIALIDADEHMKRVGFGEVATQRRVNSYFDYLDKQGKVPEQSMVRWWFAYSDSAVNVNSNHTLFQLPEQCVAVMSEQQWVSAQGRAATGGTDAAADAFAAGITKQLPVLRQTHPSYARLCAVFEIGLALQLATEATGQPSLHAWFPNLCALGSVQADENVTPKTVEGLTTWHKMKDGTIVAVVSGGVKVDARLLAKKSRWQESKFLAASLVPEPAEIPNAAHGTWWWDPE